MQNIDYLEKFDGVAKSKKGEVADGKVVYNFSPGPCILPRAVLDRCAEGIIDYKGTGQSIMEISHRKPEFFRISDMTKLELRRYLQIPDNYRIMLNQGGATLQYTAVAKNLIGLKPQRKAMYLTTGLWSSQCITEARKFIPAENLIEVASSKASNHTQLPDPDTWVIDEEASYFHFCMNETVNGFEFTEENFPWHKIPKGVATVCDMSSNIGSRPINWDHFDVVYAGAQKNLGPTGSTVIIVKESLLNNADKDVPIMCDWTTFENSPGTYYNTPPVWCIYVMGANMSYQNQLGGIEKFDKDCEIRSKMLYDLVDSAPDYYVCRVNKGFRSRVNAIFRIEGDLTLEDKFIKECEALKMVNVKGHPYNPGLRICMYNAMPIEGVVELCKFMRKFMEENPIKLPKLTYFDAYGVAETIRMSLWKAGAKFDDDRVTFQQWGELKKTGDFPFGQLPVMTLPCGKKLAQSMAILRYVGLKYNMIPSDPLAAFAGDKALELVGQDLIKKHMSKIFYAKDEDKDGMFDEAMEKVWPEFIANFEKCLSEDKKYLCGDTLTVYDMGCAGYFYNNVLNPQNRFADKWVKVWATAPPRVKKYVADFGVEMKGWLETRKPSAF